MAKENELPDSYEYILDKFGEEMHIQHIGFCGINLCRWLWQIKVKNMLL